MIPYHLYFCHNPKMFQDILSQQSLHVFLEESSLANFMWWHQRCAIPPEVNSNFQFRAAFFNSIPIHIPHNKMEKGWVAKFQCRGSEGWGQCQKRNTWVPRGGANFECTLFCPTPCSAVNNDRSLRAFQYIFCIFRWRGGFWQVHVLVIYTFIRSVWLYNWQSG